MGEINFNVTGLSQIVLTLIKNANKSLDSAKSIFASIKIPSDFSNASTVRNAVSNIRGIQDELNKANNQVNESINRLNTAQRKNNQVVNSLLSSINLSLMSQKLNIMIKNDKYGKMDTMSIGDGYPDGTYISLGGIKYKAYRQDIGSWASENFWGGTIKMWGCGPTSIAILASGLIDSRITPFKIAMEMANTGQTTLKAEMDKLGMKSTIIEQESADDIRKALKEGNIMLVSVGPKTKFTEGSHIVAVVDINSKGKVFVINPNSKGTTSSPTGWYDPNDLITGSSHNDYMIITKATVLSKLKNGYNYSGFLGYADKRADDLNFIQQKSKGAVGKIAGDKDIDCGWVSATQALILTSGDYSLTPESVAKKTRSLWGDNWCNESNYNMYSLKKTIESYGNKTYFLKKDDRSVENGKKLLDSGDVIIVNAGNDQGGNYPFYKSNGTARPHENHTILFYKYENGYFYAKDSSEVDGGTRCPYPEDYWEEFLNSHKNRSISCRKRRKIVCINN